MLGQMSSNEKMEEDTDIKGISEFGIVMRKTVKNSTSEEYSKSCEYYGDCSVVFVYSDGEIHVVRGKCLFGMDINWVCPRMKRWRKIHKDEQI